MKDRSPGFAHRAALFQGGQVRATATDRPLWRPAILNGQTRPLGNGGEAGVEDHSG